jgi:geranylgeranyl reductase family protein
MSAAANNIFDVAVIGAGPAGGSAALALAQKGLKVRLLEKAKMPRYKTCGGGILHRAYQLLPPGIENVVERNFHSVALNFLGTDLNFVTMRPGPMVHLVMRAEMDQRLAYAARDAGAKLLESCPVKNVTVQKELVELATPQGVIRAKFVVAADGVYSPTAKALGWPDLPKLAPALEYEIHVDAETFAKFGNVPRFDFNGINAGYAWVFPKRSHLSVGILSTRRTCPDLPAQLMNYVARIGITRIEKMEKHGYLIPLAPRREPLVRGRVLLVGDAGGLVDPVTAEGISHALMSGQFAATALVDGDLNPPRVAEIYQSLLEKHILSELRAARIFAKVLYDYPRVRNWAFRQHGQTLSDFVGGIVMGERRYADALTTPANYLKMFGLKRG